jgi:signal transduction histidine kinase
VNALQRMQHMSAALSHDMNNYTGIIQGYVELMRLELDPEHECHTYLDRLQQVCDKMLERSRTLETFSGKRSLPLYTHDLGDIVASELQGRERVELQADCGDFAIAAHPDTLRQALRQMLDNAQEASPDEPVRVRLRGDDENVYLEIENDGAEGEPERWFDPYYSTRGKGRGLGLARVYGMAAAHKATLQARIDEQRRSTVELRFSRGVERAVE